MNCTLRLAFACAGLLALASAAHGQQLYGLSSSTPGRLYTIDAATGTASNPVTVTGADSTNIVGLAFLNGTLYASDVFSNNAYRFGRLDPTTGAFTAINDQGGSMNWFALTPNTGANLLYVFDFNNVSLKTVTPTGTITTIGAPGYIFGGLAYDNAAGILYGVDIKADLYTINTTTAVSTLVGYTGVSGASTVLDLALGASGTLYLNDGVGHKLYTVNTGTGVATLVGSNGVTDQIDGLAFLPAATSVPEPGVVTFASVLALSGCGLLLRRRKARFQE